MKRYLVCVLPVLLAAALPASAEVVVRGTMLAPGVTGRTDTIHGWMEEHVYAASARSATGYGALSGHTPPGAFEIRGPESGRELTLFTLKFDGIPAFSYKSGLRVADGTDALDGVTFETDAHYSVMYNTGPEEWGQDPWVLGTDFYQTFVATGPHVTRLATRLADKRPEYTQLVLNYAIYQPGDGPPSTWKRISPVRSRTLSPTTDPIIHIFWVPYRSNEVELVPGQRYAFRLWRDDSSQSTEFVVVARRDDGTGYAGGQLYVGDEPREEWDAFGYVSGGAAGTVVNHAAVDGFGLDELLGWSNRFGQTFRATGTGLAALDLVFATGGQDNALPVAFQVYDGVGGTPIGPAKSCIGVPGAFQGRVAVYWAPGEVPLVPDKTYYIEGRSPGMNVWRMEDDLPGEAYIEGESKAPYDIRLSIAEYVAAARSDAGSATGERILGYIDRMPDEPAAARARRHEQVAARRAQEHLLLVHRGASRFAPENTLEAYAAALDGGADGVEIDIRRSKDGVLYLFHDDTLDRMTGKSGKVRDQSYYELLAAAPENGRPPTLAAALELVRRRAALLHLDIKEPGLEDDLVRIFDEADVWDHIVHVNPYHSDRIRTRPGLELYEYKGWVDDHMGWLRQENADLDDPAVYQSFLERPGKMLFTKNDPADGARMLGRRAAEPVPLPDNVRAWWTPAGIAGLGD